jgi:hypothetical protein
MEKINLELDVENFPQLLSLYSLDTIKEMAATMALKQYFFAFFFIFLGKIR